MLKKGDIVVRPVPVLKDPGGATVVTRPMKGRVIFVHSRHRFHTIEVDHGTGKLKYTYDGVG